jgi:hypothetical protein
LVSKVVRALKVLKVHKVVEDQPEFRALKVLPALKDPLASKVDKVPKAHKDHKVVEDQLEYQVFKDHHQMVHLDSKVDKVLKDQQVARALKDHLVLKDQLVVQLLKLLLWV